MEVQISFFNVVGKQKTTNGKRNSNSVFQSRKKTKNVKRNWKLEFHFKSD